MEEKGLVNISDLLGDDGNMAPFEEIKRKFSIEGIMLDDQGLVETLPQEWKRRQGIKKEPDPVTRPNIQEVLKQKKGSDSYSVRYYINHIVGSIIHGKELGERVGSD